MAQPFHSPPFSSRRALAQPSTPSLQSHLRPLAWLVACACAAIGSAHAQGQPDISIKTPAIQAIQGRMAARFDSTLRKGFDAGALGFGKDGMIVLREPGALELKDRAGMQAAVADDNRDRKAVYKEVAVANGHPEWESQIRDVFSKQWVDSARGGWWYQDKGGAWKQK